MLKTQTLKVEILKGSNLKIKKKRNKIQNKNNFRRKSKILTKKKAKRKKMKILLNLQG